MLHGVSAFTPSSIHISNAMFTRSLLLATSLTSVVAVQYGTEQWRVCYYSSNRL